MHDIIKAGRMLMKDKILKQITDYYLNSGDFNGFPLYNTSTLSSKTILI